GDESLPTGCAKRRRQQDILATVGTGLAQAPPTPCTKGGVLRIDMLAGGAWADTWHHRGWREREGGSLRRQRWYGRLIREQPRVRHKAIPIAPLRLNDALRLPAVPHHDPHGPQAALQRGITNRQPLPHLLAQFLLGDHAVAMLKKIAEHLEDFWRQPGTLARPLQGIEVGVQDTIGK